MGNWQESMYARVTPRLCLISLICSAGEVPTQSPCALITHSMNTCCPGDTPVIGRMTEASNNQLHRPVDASVMRPITGVSPGQHVFIECVINAHGDCVGTSPAEQMSDIKHKRGVTLAYMLSCQFPIYPDCGRMEYSLKFDPYRRILPFTRGVEDSPIPDD